jgi:hypothetical protein
VYGILAGYEDCNDHDALRDEPVFKMVAGKLPQDDPLASQPTLCRFENSVTIPVLYQLMDFLVQTGIERLREKHGGSLPAKLTLDLDATDDPAHGQQQLVLFHGYYGQYQYFPLVVSEPTTKHAFLVWLRPGTVHAALGADDDLLKVVNALGKERPDIQVHVRGDAAFGMPWMYRAESWDRDRTVIAKAECHAGGTNLRFVITNLPTDSDEQARARYDDYIERGESEQRMDELKNGLCAGRLSCCRFLANFWRLLLHAGAYNLLNALRDHEQVPPELRVAQPQTWRTRLIKVAAVIVQSTRRVVVRLAGQWPWWEQYLSVSRRALQFTPVAPSS